MKKSFYIPTVMEGWGGGRGDGGTKIIGDGVTGCMFPDKDD